MNTFKHKSLYAALAGLGALSAAGVSQAVSVNQNGLGQALIYPYYTVRTALIPIPGGDASYNSLLSVVNSTATAKAVKVRFLEGRNSREVLDFNLYLSAHDVWTTAIIPTKDASGNDVGGIYTTDKSCTVPIVSSSAAAPTLFVNYAYTGSNDDKAGGTLDRTKEGYVEIIEMGDVIGSTAVAATHVNGTPPCTAKDLDQPIAPANTIPGTGGLFGSMTLINVLRGEDFAYDPTALEGFSSTALWFSAGDIKPNLTNVNPKTSVVVTGSSVYITDWTASSNTVDAVSAVLMHNNIYNEYVLDPSTRSGTDWIVTMPTKNFYYSGLAVTKLFQSNFGAGGACDDVVITQYDREERFKTGVPGFSPPPPTQVDGLCWEANVITWHNGANGNDVFGSKNRTFIDLDFVNGWIGLFWNGSSVPANVHRLTGGSSTVFNTRTGGTITLIGTTFYGLPTVGFAAEVFENSALGPIQANYGGNLNHKFTVDVR